MGIGIATGDVIVGNIGSEKRTKYGAVGSSVNLAARIESYSLGGEVLIDEETLRARGGIVRTSRVRDVVPKGFGRPLLIHSVAGIGGDHDLELASGVVEFLELEKEIPILITVLVGSEVPTKLHSSRVWARSQSGVRIHTDLALSEFSQLRIELAEDVSAAESSACYAKVERVSSGPDGFSELRFTSRSAQFDSALEDAPVRAARTSRQ